MKIALALIVKGSNEEAAALRRCLRNVSPYVDGIFITSTHKKGEEPNKMVDEVCSLFNANVSYYEWNANFADARNFNFDQVPEEYDYILWCDADDAFRGLEKLRDTIEANPTVDAFAFYYLYAFDEYKNPIVVHQKTQVIKRGSAVWEGYLHEDFKPLRKLETKFVEGIERLHLTDDNRIGVAKERNLEVARKQAEDFPNDPRSYWNLGNSLKACGKNEEAIEALKRFLDDSESDEEKYIVRLRMAESLWSMGKKAQAIDEARMAIGTRPEYPDAYHLLGSLYLETQQYERAKEMYTQGLMRKPPYYSIIVYNPRDYDYVPLMNLAKVYFSLNLPTLAMVCLEGCLKIYPEDKNLLSTIELMKKEVAEFEAVSKLVADLNKIEDKEKLKEELDKVPEKYKAHPGIVNIRNTNFIKETSNGREISIFCGFTEEVWTPETARAKGIGGSEEAVIWLSRLLARRGWQVSVYNNCGPEQQTFDGVAYKPFWTFNYRDKQDAVILWRTPKGLDWNINAPKVFLDLHDVVDPGEFTKERLKKVSKIFVKSEFHRSLFPEVPDEKFVIIPNGIDSERFKESAQRDPMLMINTSSPDRSLSALLDCFEMVKKEVPEVKLKWAYGFGVFDTAHGDNQKIMEWKDQMIKRMQDLGVENLGRISHEEIAKLSLQANIFAYPSEFAEIDCISLTKAMASGAVPVTTDFAAMGGKKDFGGVFVHSDKTKDTWVRPYQFDFALEDESKKQEWADAVIKLLKNPLSEEERNKMRETVRETFDWDKITDVWQNQLCL